jgi:dipeptidyl aminopeptidase/acylaminoacyl peptidase
VPTGLSMQNYFKGNGFHYDLAENPKTYIENSTILYAKNISTPLLLRHNDDDLQVPVAQSLQLFIHAYIFGIIVFG